MRCVVQLSGMQRARTKLCVAPCFFVHGQSRRTELNGFRENRVAADSPDRRDRNADSDAAGPNSLDTPWAGPTDAGLDPGVEVGSQVTLH